MAELGAPPCWYLWVAAVVSAYQMFRGFMLQFRFGRAVPGGPGEKTVRSWWEAVPVLCLADALTYLASAVLGFGALWLLYVLVSRLQYLADVSVGGAVLLLVLGAIGGFGITGNLARFFISFDPNVLSLRR